MALQDGYYNLNLAAQRSDGVTFNSVVPVTVGNPNTKYIDFIAAQENGLAIGLTTEIVIPVVLDFLPATETSSAQGLLLTQAPVTQISFLPATEVSSARQLTTSIASPVRLTFTRAIEVDSVPNLVLTKITAPSTGFSLSENDIDRIVTAVFARVIENNETFLDQIKLIRAEAAGSLTRQSLGENVEIRIKDSSGTKDRIVATVDSTGQRTITSKDLT